MPEDKDKYNKPRKKIPNYKREPGKLPTFEIDPNSEKVLPEALEAAERYRKIKNKSSDFPMSKEGSPTVTDTETGKVTYGKPEKFEHGGMASCRGMGKAIKGGKFIGVK
jgi:hypothetical protein